MSSSSNPSPPLPRLDGRRVLLTGATGGLGRAVAERCWQLGASLALAARPGPALDQLVAGLTTAASGPQECFGVPADLTDPGAPETILRAVTSRWPHLDVLVNNAGIVGPIGALSTSDWAAWQQTIQVNLMAPVALCRLLIPYLPAGGSIINLSGGGATGPRPNFSAYATSKAGLVRFTENLAVELAGQGLRVNAVAPGAMNTKMLDAVLEAGPEAAGGEFGKSVSQKEKGGVAPATAAELVAWLAGSGSAGISGRLISAVWDPWASGLAARSEELAASDIYTLRRITPEDRGKKWN